ncbi:MAG: nitrous oxide-stimulated promoter family protein [Anaerolineae bacterium]|nr:nitrous oxide-stimulated promoter family protein [Anaerolineae bacterium]
MRAENPRLKREAKTLTAMVGLYCHGHHLARGHHDAGPRGQLCADCQDLLDYTLFRLSKCPFQAGKPTCAHCPIHCYTPARRQQIRIVMRYAGPRMLLHHPVLAILHLLDGVRKPNLNQHGSQK